MNAARLPIFGWSTLSCLLVLALGCGPDLGSPATVTGKVTVDGQPLSGATVAFHCTGGLPAEYRTARATTDSSGSYTLAKVYPGSYTVTVIETTAGAGDGAEERDPGAQSAFAEETLRPASGNELRAEVHGEAVAFDIQLTRPKSKSRRR